MKRRSTKAQKKVQIFHEILESLINEKITSISNPELINIFNTNYDVSLRDMEITQLGFRDLLNNYGISTKDNLEKKKATDKILKETINWLKNQNQSECTIRQFHVASKNFGYLSEPTVRYRVADIVSMGMTIISNVPNNRIDASTMSEKDIIIAVAKKYIKENIQKVWPGDFRRKAAAHYKSIPLKAIKNSANFLKDTYDLVLLGTEQDQQNDRESHKNIDTIKHWIKEFKKPIEISYTNSIAESFNMGISRNFFVSNEVSQKKRELWDEYISKYLLWVSDERINVKNAFVYDGSITINTPKKQYLLLSHPDFSIEHLSVEDYVKLTYAPSLAGDKAYGLHMQNFYIGFLLFLHSKGLLILPFHYVYENCYIRKKVQVEVPFFLSENHTYRSYSKALQENRLNEKDDKYKRLFLFFLYTLPCTISIETIRYQHLAELKNTKPSEYTRVRRILNTMGAHIVEEKPKIKYNERFLRFMKMARFKSLTDHFTMTMNRAYKLGSYANEKDFYKDWSGEYANFLTYIEKIYVNETLSESFLYRIFNFPDEGNLLTYQQYVEDLALSSQTKFKRFTPLIAAFEKSDKFQTLKNLKDRIPVFTDTSDPRSKRDRRPITDYAILEKIEQIVCERPPASDYYKKLNLDPSIIAWWPHYKKVAPFEPLIIRLHLHIPARGINFRLADRDTFVVADQNRTIKAFHFTHDKNKKRKTAYIAPNIWKDDLNFVFDLIEYNKVHFPHLSRVYYDKQNPQGILPLFPDQSGKGFYGENQHMTYWKRVLLKTQLEFQQDGKKVVLVYSKDPKFVLPVNAEDVDLLTQGEINQLEAVYDLHSLRHTGATKYANAMMPFSLLMLLTGHVNPNVLFNVYVEVNIQKMTQEWEKIQATEVAENIFSNVQKRYKDAIQSKTKEMLLQNNREELLEYLTVNHYFSVGSFLGKEELEQKSLEDFSHIDPIFWTPKRFGFCTSSSCPPGLENRCSLCPHHITCPAFAGEIANYINLQNFRVQKYINMVIAHRDNGMLKKNEALGSSALLEIEDMLGWIEILTTANNILKNNPISLTDENSNMPVALSQEDIFRISNPINKDHMLMKLVYDSFELHSFDRESTFDAADKLVSKLIRYAGKTGRFSEIEDMNTIEILEWFKPMYERTQEWEISQESNAYLKAILDVLSRKNVRLAVTQNKDIKQIENKGKNENIVCAE